jgi:nucleoid-associated protein EbfC
MSGFDLDALMKQAQEMQAQVQKLQQEAANETVTASAGGGMVTVTATAGGEVKQIEIDPKAIDPSDPELLADLITAAVNEALRNGQALLSSKLGEAMPPGLGGLLPGL